VGVTYFAQRFRNMIDYTGSTNACGASYCNVAAASASGVELEGRVAILPELVADANVTVLDAHVVNAGFDTTSGGLYRAGQRLIRRPRHTLNAGLAYHLARGSIDLRVSRVGARDDKDFRPFPAVSVVDPAYTRADLGAALEVVPRAPGRPAAWLTLRAENLFDANYESIFNFRSPRRTILSGVRLAF
jgi:outer membrane cobalamin receptor